MRSFHGKDQPFSAYGRIDNTDQEKELMKTNQTEQRLRFPTRRRWMLVFFFFFFFFFFLFLCLALLLHKLPWQFDLSEKEKVFMGFSRSTRGSENRVSEDVSLSLCFLSKEFSFLFVGVW
ncbi:hypothetical protein EUTSA_v10001077mg [Eutrema salsugineum]|uniref:Uncharacterized protein n=1 Tax=Eutrema salsugineum TaxID=72664 RepID=V4N3W6_EUTSA|nr:hypothetical protein EUTSA_v10001077mg [Eutrema salsugineum]